MYIGAGRGDEWPGVLGRAELPLRIALGRAEERGRIIQQFEIAEQPELRNERLRCSGEVRVVVPLELVIDVPDRDVVPGLIGVHPERQVQLAEVRKTRGPVGGLARS